MKFNKFIHFFMTFSSAPHSFRTLPVCGIRLVAHIVIAPPLYLQTEECHVILIQSQLI